jgi:hypothetical protein
MHLQLTIFIQSPYNFRTILKAKAPLKPYCRLPYIIGSKEYEEDDFIGLREPSNLVTSPELDALPVDEV